MADFPELYDGVFIDNWSEIYGQTEAYYDNYCIDDFCDYSKVVDSYEDGVYGAYIAYLVLIMLGIIVVISIIIVLIYKHRKRIRVK